MVQDQGRKKSLHIYGPMEKALKTQYTYVVAGGGQENPKLDLFLLIQYLFSKFS